MFGNRMLFNLFLEVRFLMFDKLEQLEFKLEKKILGFKNIQEKIEFLFSVHKFKNIIIEKISHCAHMQYRSDWMVWVM